MGSRHKEKLVQRPRGGRQWLRLPTVSGCLQLDLVRKERVEAEELGRDQIR